MQRYYVLNTFKERDAEGNYTGRRPKYGQTVELCKKEAERLKTAGFVRELEDSIAYETTSMKPPEKRGRGRPKKHVR